MYTLVFTENAKKGLKELSKKAPLALAKLSKLLEEVREHPRTGNRTSRAIEGLRRLCLFQTNHQRAPTCI